MLNANLIVITVIHANITMMISMITMMITMMITGGSSKERVLEQIALIRQRAESIMKA